MSMSETQDVCYLVEGLRKSHRVGRGGSVLANDGLDLAVPVGEVFGLLGPNGAGKSTLVRQLTGLLRPDQGRVTLLGHDIVKRPRDAARLVAYLAQTEGALAELPVALAVRTTALLRGLTSRQADAACAAVLAELDLAGLAERPLARLSGGQRRLAEVATALVGERPVLVLDEPTTGMDPAARRAVWAALERRRAEAGVTIVLVTHNVIEAETVLDRVAVMDAGRIVACDSVGRLKASVADQVRLDLVWREPPPVADATVAAIAARATVTGRRWSARMGPEQARRALAELTEGPAFAALDDFTLATPSLEDVYLALGGRAGALAKG